MRTPTSSCASGSRASTRDGATSRQRALRRRGRRRSGSGGAWCSTMGDSGLRLHGGRRLRCPAGYRDARPARDGEVKPTPPLLRGLVGGHGDIDPSPTDPTGLFSRDSRFLSRWVLTIDASYGAVLRPMTRVGREMWAFWLIYAVFGLAERRRSRTYQPWGCHGLPVLKIGRVSLNEAAQAGSAPPIAPPVQDHPQGR
jgi:N-terminal domain of (some) glycogen debranching enzymes